MCAKWNDYLLGVVFSLMTTLAGQSEAEDVAKARLAACGGPGLRPSVVVFAWVFGLALPSYVVPDPAFQRS